jgi:hypothetical protein
MSKLLHDGPHLLYSTELAAKIGRNEAICLQQIHYWMSISGGKVVDGIKWFWKTYQEWSKELQLSVSTVRRVIRNLKTLGLIGINRLSAKTYYQANWYTLKIEAIEALVQNEHIDAIALDSSMRSKSTDHIKDFPAKEFSPQQHVDVEKKGEVDWEAVTKEIQVWEQSQITNQTNEPETQVIESSTQYPEQSEITCYADKIEEVSLTSLEDSNEDQSSATASQVEVDMTFDNLTNPEIESSGKNYSSLEISQICRELKQLRINPDPCLGVIKKYWENVAGAIARVKEAMNEGWCNNPTGLFINLHSAP